MPRPSTSLAGGMRSQSSSVRERSVMGSWRMTPEIALSVATEVSFAVISVVLVA